MQKQIVNQTNPAPKKLNSFQGRIIELEALEKQKSIRMIIEAPNRTRLELCVNDQKLEQVIGWIYTSKQSALFEYRQAKSKAWVSRVLVGITQVF